MGLETLLHQLKKNGYITKSDTEMLRLLKTNGCFLVEYGDRFDWASHTGDYYVLMSPKRRLEMSKRTYNDFFGTHLLHADTKVHRMHRLSGELRLNDMTSYEAMGKKIMFHREPGSVKASIEGKNVKLNSGLDLAFSASVVEVGGEDNPDFTQKLVVARFGGTRPSLSGKSQYASLMELGNDGFSVIYKRTSDGSETYERLSVLTTSGISTLLTEGNEEIMRFMKELELWHAYRLDETSCLYEGSVAGFLRGFG